VVRTARCVGIGGFLETGFKRVAAVVKRARAGSHPWPGHAAASRFRSNSKRSHLVSGPDAYRRLENSVASNGGNDNELERHDFC
jgi:hypothetical protein